MKIKTSSWHFKLQKGLWSRSGPWPFGHTFNDYRTVDDAPRSLCGYFWVTVFSVLVSVPYLLIFGGAWVLWKVVIRPFGRFVVLPVINVIIAIEPERDEEKQPGLLREYIKAKKSRMCPLIEYKHKP